MPPLSLDAIVVVASDQLSCDLNGEAAILDAKRGIYYGLDSVGARVWTLVQAPITVDKICHALQSEYDVEPEHCRRDVLVLLQDLAEHELIEIRDAPAP